MASALLLVISVLILHLSAASAAAHRRASHVLPGPKADSSGTASSSDAIQQACAASRFRQLCVSAISSLPPSLPPNPSAVDLSLAALSASARGLQAARADARAILDSAAAAANVNRTNAARNCLEFLSLADHRLAASSEAISAGDLAGARLFAGAAELYQYDCWSAYKYVNGTQQVADAMASLYALANLTGSAASMVAALQRYGGNMSLWAPPQTERDGYWPPDVPTAKASERVDAASEAWSPDATVCQEGGECQFTTVQAAVDAAPERAPRRHVIYIKQGIYAETVRVPLEKPNLAFIGDGMGKTVITGSLNAGVPGVSTYNTATVGE